MILQFLNIAAGFILAVPEFKNHFSTQKELFERISIYTASWKETFGLVTLAFGVIGLLVRLNLLPAFIPELGSSFPQAIPAILIGTVLALPKLERFPTLATHVRKLLPYTFPLGLLGVAVGIGSLLFGCVVPTLCRLPL